MKFYSTGTWKIYATSVDYPDVKGFLEIKVLPEEADHFILSFEETPKIGDNLLKIEVRGKNNTPSYDYTGTVHLSEKNNSTNISFNPSVFQFRKSDYAVKIVTVTFIKTGIYEIVAYDSKGVSGSTQTIITGSGSLDHFDIIVPTTVYSGEKFVLKIYAYDKYDNQVTGFNNEINIELEQGGYLHLKDINTYMSNGYFETEAIIEKQGDVSEGKLTVKYGNISSQEIFTLKEKEETIQEIEKPKNFPNPFNPDKEETKIRYYLKKNSEVKVSIYTLTGEQVFEKTFSGKKGINYFSWNGKDNKGRKLLSGGYIVYIKKNDGTEPQKLKICILRK